MSQEIYIPPGDEGDEILIRTIPNLHKLAQRKENLKQ